jgi:adenosylcobalamin-dependent ribonucleoside-triphosphate reductase
VVAGNTRRSAELILGNPDDKDFILLKQDKKKLMHHRWASNNSIAAREKLDYKEFAKSTAINGEPGYIWLENSRKFGRLKDPENWEDVKVKGFNPCAEQNLESFELCNLVETMPVNHETFDDFKITLKYAYLYAKTVTLVPIHDTRTNAVMMRNRRIGTSMSGITQAMNKFGKREFFNWCDVGYKYLRELDKMYSDWLCIPRSIKITTVKPSGTVSLLPGVTPGIHYPHSEYYIRNVRVAKNSPLLTICKEAGYHTEDDKYSPTTAVVSFPVHEKYFIRGKDEVSMWEQLENAAQMQYYWSDNAVSITVTFNKQEAKYLNEALQLYETRLKSVSFLPLEDHGYEQAPYITITKEKYEHMKAKITPIKIKESVHDSADKYCDGEACLIN